MTGRHHPVDVDRQRPLAILASHTTKATFQSDSPLPSPYSHKFAARRGSEIQQRWPRRGIFLVGVVASIVSLVTVLSLLALCRTNQRRLVSREAMRRRLSDTDDDRERSDILEQCLDLEEELGNPLAASERVDESNEVKARLVDMLYASAASFERMRAVSAQRLQGEVQFPPLKIPRFHGLGASISHLQTPSGPLWPHPSQVAMRSEVSALETGAWATTDYGLAFGGGGDQQHLPLMQRMPRLQHDASLPQTHQSEVYVASTTTWLSPFSVGRPTSGGAALTPEGWLDDPLANIYQQSSQQVAVGTVWRNPVVEAASTAPIDAGSVGTPSEGAGNIGSMTAGAAAGKGRAVPTVQMSAAQQREHQTPAVVVNLDAVKGSASAPAVKAARRGGAGKGEAPSIRQHPFVRLPAVNPEDIHRSFRKEFALTLDLNNLSPMESYRIMRILFAKPSLTAEEVNALIKEAELLANYAVHKLTKRNAKQAANYIARKLSSVFMAFDYIVSTIEILGSKMNTEAWWTQFAQKFDTDYSFPEPARTERANKLNNLVNRLSSALAIYKQAKRPALEEIVALKRIILASAYTGSQLSHPLWRLWVQDDEDFSGSAGEVESSARANANDRQESKEP